MSDAQPSGLELGRQFVVRHELCSRPVAFSRRQIAGGERTVTLTCGGCGESLTVAVPETLEDQPEIAEMMTALGLTADELERYLADDAEQTRLILRALSDPRTAATTRAYLDRLRSAERRH